MFEIESAKNINQLCFSNLCEQNPWNRTEAARAYFSDMVKAARERIYRDSWPQPQALESRKFC